MKIHALLLAIMVPCTALADVGQDCAALYANPKIDPVRAKVPFSPPATFAQLTDKSKPTDAEQLALVEYDKARIGCSNAIVADMADQPGFVQAFSRAVHDEQEARAELFSGKLTFGEYNTASQRIMRALDATVGAQAQRPAGSSAVLRGAAAGAASAPRYEPFPKPLICTSTRRGTLVDTYCR